jgi:hypothetical protein
MSDFAVLGRVRLQSTAAGGAADLPTPATAMLRTLAAREDVKIVPLPPGWEWLDELPDEWEPPAELGVPTSVTHTNLAIKIMSCDFIGHETSAAVGRFVTEHALFTMWYVREVKQSGQWTGKQAGILAGIPSEQTRVVYEAWKAFDDVALHTAPSENLRERRAATQAALATALNSAATTLADTRATR